eukprot:TRINITY_DN21532_c0_g1_i1.p1 TRINITY_DN21532_c0_g1~~TRINITY_DN21532_c0_g1_i1.p1  ORF type:complete len:501 (-),score=129.51 TRINITY_DN21532_c0_g1_i1:98-1600(-)
MSESPMKKPRCEHGLSNENLEKLKPGCTGIAYDRASTTTGIVHLGIGAFHRAHQALYTDDILATAGCSGWGITAVSLRRPDIRNLIKPQDFLFTLLERGVDGVHARVLGSVLDVLVAPEAPARVIDVLASPEVKIVTLTITEKGYCCNLASKSLMDDHPDVVHDLAHIDAPKSALGFLVAALAKRKARGDRPFTVLPCDNMPSNGSLVRTLVSSFANAVDPELGAWILQEGRFPCSMVDRIVPAVTEEDVLEAEALTGLSDPGAVGTEKFKQWVIEDSFVDGQRPPWEAAGALLVEDVEPFEKMKLRMLNGTHSTFAYCGFLAGFKYIYEVMEDATMVKLMNKLLSEEVVPTLSVPAGVDLVGYQAALADRFKNPQIKHQTYQIATDGSVKLPQRILAMVREAKAPTNTLALAAAGWMRYVRGVDEQGAPIEVKDPMSEELHQKANVSDNAEEVAKSLFGIEAIFGAVADNSQFKEQVVVHLKSVMANGMLNTIRAHVDQ